MNYQRQKNLYNPYNYSTNTTNTNNTIKKINKQSKTSKNNFDYNNAAPAITLKDKYKNHWLIINSNSITKIGVAIMAAITTIYLTALSIINKDIEYPESHPYLFTIETLLFSVGMGLLIFLMAYGRGVLGYDTVIQFIIISLKFGIIQLLFQFSGFYTWAFSE